MTDTRTHYTRQEAADALGCSLRTVDRWFPRGIDGRTERTPTPDKPDGVLIERRLIERRLAAPGGDDVADTE